VKYANDSPTWRWHVNPDPGLSCSDCGHPIPVGTRFFVRWREDAVSDGDEVLCPVCKATQEILDGDPKEDAPERTPEPRRRPRRRHYGRWVALAVLVGFVLYVAGGGLTATDPPCPPGSKYDASGLVAACWVGDRMVKQFDSTPDGPTTPAATPPPEGKPPKPIDLRKLSPNDRAIMLTTGPDVVVTDGEGP
jgi:hypothetical protein